MSHDEALWRCLTNIFGDLSLFLCRGSARGGDPSSGIWRPWVEERKAYRDECVLGQLRRFIEHDLEASSTSGGSALLSETLKTSSLLATGQCGNMRLLHGQSGHSVSKT